MRSTLSKSLSRGLFTGAMAVGISACAVSSVFLPYPNQATEFQAALSSGVVETAMTSLNKKAESSDSLLYRLERGRIQQLTDNYEASKNDFISAIAAFDGQDLEAKVQATKLAASTFSLLSNDNAKSYQGYGYERTFLHNFQIFNYLGTKDLQGATVEMRKAALEQRVMEEEHEKEIAKAHKKAEDNKLDLTGFMSRPELAGLDEIAGNVKNSFQNAYTFYTSAVIWEATGDYNAALVDFKKALEMNPENQMLIQDVLRVQKRMGSSKYGKLPKSNEGVVVFLYEDQFVPARQEFRLDVPMIDGSIKSIALPYYSPSNRPLNSPLRVAAQGAVSTDTVQIGDTYALAAKALKEKMPGILVRQILRVRAKHEAQKKAQEENAALGFAANLYNLVSERADLRTWLTLPATTQVARLHLPQGEQSLTLTAGSTSIDVPLKVRSEGRTTLVRAVNANGRLIVQTFDL